MVYALLEAAGWYTYVTNCYILSYTAHTGNSLHNYVQHTTRHIIKTATVFCATAMSSLHIYSAYTYAGAIVVSGCHGQSLS